MSDDYTAFSEKLGEIEVVVKETERAGIELPPLIVERLCNGVVCYIEANEEFSKGEDGKASEELQKALKHVRRASFDVLKFRFLFYSEFVRSVIGVLKKRKRLALECITNYDEQSENFPEIIKLIDDAELPDRDSPKSQTACEDVIKKLQAFLSNFKTGKGELFPMIYAESKIDFYGIPSDYALLKSELFAKLGVPKMVVKMAREKGEKFPLPVAKELFYSMSHYIKADKELFNGNKEGAVTEMRKAVYHLRWALFYTMKYVLLRGLQGAHDACTKFRQYEDVVLFCAPQYNEHFDNLRAIRRNIESKNWSDDDPLEGRDIYKNAEKLQAFLSGLEKDEGKFLRAIKKEQESMIRELLRKIGWLLKPIRALMFLTRGK